MPKVDGVCGNLPKNVCERFSQTTPAPIPERHRGKFFKPYGKNNILPRYPQSAIEIRGYEADALAPANEKPIEKKPKEDPNTFLKWFDRFMERKKGRTHTIYDALGLEAVPESR
ncbi:MAG: hypothetical protein K2J67_11205 [Lachnospiraceae bacterium]|nr:hypothetical protein [Lachnospiraceae bacterium]